MFNHQGKGLSTKCKNTDINSRVYCYPANCQFHGDACFYAECTKQIHSASNGQERYHAFPSGPGLRPWAQGQPRKAVLMTVAQRPNVSQRGREKLARLGSLDLATEFSMWSESK